MCAHPSTPYANYHRLPQAAEKILHAPSVQALSDAIGLAARELGFTWGTAALLALPQEQHDRQFAQPLKYPFRANWLGLRHPESDKLNTAHAAARDPIIIRLNAGDAVVAYDQDLYVKHRAADLWEEQAPLGYSTGVSLGLRLLGHRRLLFGFDSSEPLPEDRSTLTSTISNLQALAFMTEAAYSRLDPEWTIHTPSLVNPLTSRECECLAWTSEGKTAWDIAHILNVSEAVVNKHLSAATRKLNCTNKVHAVARAIHLKIIT